MLTKCPYCGKKISYLTLFRERTRGEHFCGECRKESKICIQKRALAAFVIVALLAVIIAVISVIFIGSDSFMPVLLTLIPFIIYALVSPIFIVLRPYKKYKEWMTAHTGAVVLGENLNQKAAPDKIRREQLQQKRSPSGGKNYQRQSQTQNSKKRSSERTGSSDLNK